MIMGWQENLRCGLGGINGQNTSIESVQNMREFGTQPTNGSSISRQSISGILAPSAIKLLKAIVYVVLDAPFVLLALGYMHRSMTAEIVE